MKTLGIGTHTAIAVSAIFLAGPISGLAGTDLNFNGITNTVEGAKSLSWYSQSNEVYEIDYADSLIDTNTGTITWNTLYTDYPSHGTNTFILDTGNYNVEPSIPHPKYSPIRFYRIALTGTNDGEIPFISITSPTNSGPFSDQVSVTVMGSSSYPVLMLHLWVDGQRMDDSDNLTNWTDDTGVTNYVQATFTLNTCEWPNGPHTLFATAEAQSAMAGPPGPFPIQIGRAVSSYVPVTFNNLISRVAFSQVFFEPSLGQTQEVTASFAANCNWTLQMEDEDSNVVRTVTGSGKSLDFDWDGTGDGGVAIADGVYYYYISAQTNGLPAPNGDTNSSDGGGTNSPPSPAFSTSMESTTADSSELWAMPADGSGSAFPFKIYPPGDDTNNLVFFYASPDFDTSLTSDGLMAASDSTSSDAAPDYSGPSAQATTAPTRTPTAPVKNAVNNYAIGFMRWSTAETDAIPKNGLPFPSTGVVHLNGCSTCSSMVSDNIPMADDLAVSMIAEMKNHAWKLAFEDSDHDLTASKMQRSDQGYGGSEIFTQGTIGLFLDHGSYGDDPDYNPGSSGSLQTYFRINSPGDAGWLRMCQFGFGGNLKWMAMLACFSLTDPNYGNMVSHGAIPLKTTHLLCGISTIGEAEVNIGKYWAKKMLSKNPETVRQAWFDAGSKAYHEANTNEETDTIIFRVTGYPECIDDTVANNTAPSSPSPAPGNLIKRDQQVYP